MLRRTRARPSSDAVCRAKSGAPGTAWSETSLRVGKKLSWFGEFGGAPSVGFCCRHLATPSPKPEKESRTAGGPSLFAMTLAQKVCHGSQVLSGRLASRANNFAEACAHLVLEAVNPRIPVALSHASSSYMWSMDIYRRLYDLRPTVSHLDWRLAAEFDVVRPSGAGTWTFLQCCRLLTRVAISAVSQISFIRTAGNDLRNRPERQEISLTCGVYETRLPLGSSVLGNRTPWGVDGTPAAIQSLNTGIRGASYSDAADHLQRFEALAVSHSFTAWQN